jgi:hypothetical protein
LLPEGAGKCLPVLGFVSMRVVGFYAGVMTRITIEVPDDVAERVNAAAAEAGVAPEALAGQVVVEQFPARRRLGFVALGSSTSGRRAAEDEEMLAEGFGS